MWAWCASACSSSCVEIAHVRCSRCLCGWVRIYVWISSECPWEWCVSSRADQGPLPGAQRQIHPLPRFYTVTLRWTATYGATKKKKKNRSGAWKGRPQLPLSSQHLEGRDVVEHQTKASVYLSLYLISCIELTCGFSDTNICFHHNILSNS